MKPRSFARQAGGAALAVASALLLAACEMPQGPTDVNTAKKLDTKAWEGAADTRFRVSGWTPGDKATWEAELHKRSQGQNEYLRTR